jgi:Zn-dependent protease
MRANRPQYYYEPPRQGSNWLENLRPLVTPPLAYISFFVGIGVALLLLSSGSIRGAYILILLIAFPVHELSHAIVADRLGDPTPRVNGRITLNPFAQLNFIGSILVLLVGLGWAYVPITPGNLRPNPRTGHMIVAIAGPISNLLLAIICAILWHTLRPSLDLLGLSGMLEFIRYVLYLFALINLALFLFNLAPIAPLDGFVVLKGLLPYNMAYQLERLQRYGMLIFLAVFFILPLLGVPIVNWLIFNPARTITELLFNGL